MKKVALVLAIGLLVAACSQPEKKSGVTFVVADPGHFHASLVLKSMYDGVNPDVYVYSPGGPEVKDFMTRVNGYLTRPENPTTWQVKSYEGADFFDRLLREKPGNVLILAGNNQKKTDYILQAVRKGFSVFADKPMAINSAGFKQLQEAFAVAQKNGTLLYDIMTERFEITSLLQKELRAIPEVFGYQLAGTPEDPGVTKESVHHFFKFVSGAKLIRPAWFFDTDQQGEGITDVTTHLVDLVQWACFPNQAIDYTKDIKIIFAKHWKTEIRPDQFKEVTGLDHYPDYLLPRVAADSVLRIYSNGEINYCLKGIYVKVSVAWNYKAPEGGGDTHYSVMRGSLARLEIRQGPEQQFKPELYVVPANPDQIYLDGLSNAVTALSATYPGIAIEPAGNGYHILIPDALRPGHEAHFAQVTRNFLKYLKEGALPAWEVPNMLAKYWLTTQAREISQDR